MSRETQYHNPFRCQPSLVPVVALFVAMLGCSSPDLARDGGVSLKGAGSTLVSLLFKRWFLNYQNKYPKINIAYASVGSGEGIRRFIGKNLKEEDRVDFGATDAAL